MKQSIVFTLSAEAVAEAPEGLLLGDFNNWNQEEGITMKKQKDGSLKAVVKLEAGKTYQYRYLLNDGRWANDYNAQNYVPVSGFHIDNCMITVSEILDIEQKPEAVKVKTVKAKTEKAKLEKPKVEKVKAEKVKPPKAGKKEVVKKKK